MVKDPSTFYLQSMNFNVPVGRKTELVFLKYFLLEVGDSVGSGDNEGEVSVESGVYEDSVEISHRYCLRCC